MKSQQIIEKISNYYSEKLAAHGATPRGVDWNDEQSQNIRFAQLLKICDVEQSFSLLDWGCGYGALIDFLNRQEIAFEYTGLDCSESMVNSARLIHAPGGARFIVGSEPNQSFDYTVASGIFNVKGTEVNRDDWQLYVIEVLNKIAAVSAKGFSFNVLTSYSDAGKMRDDLYYADPCFFFDYCKRNFSRNVSLLHDYGLYEFTILVRKLV